MIGSLACLVISAALVMNDDPHQQDAIVVCPRAFHDALRPWLDYRSAEGYRVQVLAPDGRSAQAIRDTLIGLTGKRAARTILLVGDAQRESSNTGRSAAHEPDIVPSFYIPARVTTRWGSEPWIVTDHPYSDLDDDGIPERAVGRLPVSSREMLASAVDKILGYERSNDFGTWRRRMHFVAGPGGFGPLADAAIEMAARGLIAALVPEPYTTTLVDGSLRNRHDPKRLRGAVLGRLDDAALFFVYVGHGDRDGLLLAGHTPGQEMALTSADIAGLGRHGPRPIASLFCCHAGAFDGKKACLAETLVRHGSGPVAVVAGTSVTMPYGMSVLGGELLRAYFQGRCATLGDAVLEAKRMTMTDGGGSPDRAALDAVASLLSPHPDEMSLERAEHVHLFQLFGDPLLGLRRPDSVSLKSARVVQAGSALEVSGRCRIGGRCHVDLVPARGRPARRPEASSRQPGLEGRPGSWSTPGRAGAVHEAEHDESTVDYQVCKVRNGVFFAVLQVPLSARGPHHVRAFVEDESQFALGAAHVKIEPPPVVRQARK